MAGHVDWAFGRLAAEVGFEVDESADPLDQLREAVRGFLLFSARHPDLLRLMNTEAGLDSGRLDYLFETYVREIPASTLFFLLAHGAAAPFSNEPLARRFGDTVDAQRHADLVADLLVAGLRT
ncbi:hypothetical protein [Kutzneria albida]|uniref:hypothetical protein n=1 Tax=Kutzneria albida TaxID=43357 RepID=UPI0004AF866B|nr:hypothetical protein [Kutzneria albida]